MALFIFVFIMVVPALLFVVALATGQLGVALIIAAFTAFLVALGAMS